MDRGSARVIALALALLLTAASAAPTVARSAVPVATEPGINPARWLTLRHFRLQLPSGVPTSGTRTSAPAEPSSVSTGAADIGSGLPLSTGPPAGGPAAAEIAGSLGIPEVMLAAYLNAEALAASIVPGCGVDWAILAGIGRVESGHGLHFGSAAVFTEDGDVLPAIVGPPLNGGPGVARIPDSDGGVWDGDQVWDRAVGPMQFIPSSWRLFGQDGNGDGIRNPHNAFDAALAAAIYLCRATGGDLGDPQLLARGLYSYNRSEAYVAQVNAYIAMYRGLGISGARVAMDTRPRPPGTSRQVASPPATPNRPSRPAPSAGTSPKGQPPHADRPATAPKRGPTQEPTEAADDEPPTGDSGAPASTAPPPEESTAPPESPSDPSSAEPTESPSDEPSDEPSEAPREEPSGEEPTEEPTDEPTPDEEALPSIDFGALGEAGFGACTAPTLVQGARPYAEADEVRLVGATAHPVEDRELLDVLWTVADLTSSDPSATRPWRVLTHECKNGTVVGVRPAD